MICFSERGEHRLLFGYTFFSHPWKLLKLYPTVHSYLFFLILYCIVSTENTGNLKECYVYTEALYGMKELAKFKYVFLKGENLGFYLDINFSATLENLLSYTPTVYIHISFFFLYCIVLLPLRTPATWRSAKCTRRLLKVWKNWLNSKMICYSERLLFGYKFVSLPWKHLELYPTVHS